MKPRIAIPVPTSTRTEYNVRALPQYEHAILAAGGEPVILQVSGTSREIAQGVKACDGVLLPGSPSDIDPEKYGAARDPHTTEPDSLRDNADELLLQDAYNMRKPVFGICYGLQSLNVWRTGTLIQHLETGINHDPGNDVVEAHRISLASQSMLARILESVGIPRRGGDFAVNSSHHQASYIVGDGLRVAAWSPDDEVQEALEGTSSEHFVLAVQWHPERTFDQYPASRALFRAFLEAASEWHRRLAKKQQDFESMPRK